jgi:hypothetical protein
MTNKRVALIRDGKVFDVIIAGDDYKPSKGVIHVEAETANIGDRHDGRAFIKPAPPEKSQLISAALGLHRTLVDRLQVDFDSEGELLIGILLRRDIRDIELLGKDATIVFGDKPIKLTSAQIRALRELISLKVAALHQALAEAIQAIEDGKITAYEDIKLAPPRRLP